MTDVLNIPSSNICWVPDSYLINGTFPPSPSEALMASCVSTALSIGENPSINTTTEMTGGTTPFTVEESSSSPACSIPSDIGDIYVDCIRGKFIPDDCLYGSTDDSPCPLDPGSCSSGCCCCDSAVYAETIRSRCYDMVGISCNRDGTGPVPGQTFPASCDECFTACDLLLNDPDGCSKLKTLPWWDLGNKVCDCSCKESDSNGNCLLTCAVCGKCDANVSVSNTQCNYELTLTPAAECCKENAENEQVYITFANIGSMQVLTSELDAVTTKCAELDAAITANPNIHKFGIAYGGSTFKSSCVVEEGTCETDPCVQCVDFSDTITCQPCLPSCCPEGESSGQFLKRVTDIICNYSKSSLYHNGARYEFVIFVHGLGEKIGIQGTQNDTLRILLKSMNARLHILKFTLPCQTETVSIAYGTTNDNCIVTRCRSNINDAYSNITEVCSTAIDCIVQSGSNINATGVCSSYPSALAYEFCEEINLLDFDYYYHASRQSDIDLLFATIAKQNYRPPASCDCVDQSTYVITLDNRDCSNRTIDVCGTSIVIGSPEGRTVCCDEVGCSCDADCPPYYWSAACDKPPECKCGANCIPICQNGVLLFGTLEAAVEAAWTHCKLHGEEVPGEPDCIWVDMSQPWENPWIVKWCKSLLETHVETAWNNCVGGIGGGGEDPEDPDDPTIPVIDPGGGDTPGPVAIPGCGRWAPTNIDCDTEEIIGQETGCTSVRHPDVVVLNNGIGLVAYEDTTDNSVIKVKQLHTSIKNKIHPNRLMRYGRLENPARWTDPPAGVLETGNKLFKLYYYEPIGDVTTEDQLFFLNGPFKYHVFSIYSISVDAIGNYIQLVIPTVEFSSASWTYIAKAYGNSSDDRYDVRWITYDGVDRYDTLKPNGNYIGTSYAKDEASAEGYYTPVPAGIDPELDATVVDNNNALSLPPHMYNGVKVPVAYPSIAHLDNYDNENENSHFVYVAYQALEENKWNIYLRQLRLSEFKKSSDFYLYESNLISLTDAGASTINWTCKSSCISYDCNGDTKTSTISSVWSASINGLSVYNKNLPLGSIYTCGQSFPKNIVTILLTQRTTWTGASAECPDKDLLIDWKLGDEITTSVPAFADIYDQEEINTWAQNNFIPTIISSINTDITIGDVTAQLIYHPSQGGRWAVFNDNIIQIASQYKGIYVSDPILVYENKTGHCTRPSIKTDYANRIFVVFESIENGSSQIRIVGTETPQNLLPVGTDAGWRSHAESFDRAFNFFYSVSDFTYDKAITTEATNQHPRMWIDLNNVIHLTWHSNIDNRWEIYYCNSDNNFTQSRITNYLSRSFNPDICGNDQGDIYIVWHDDRFGPWEIMIAYYDGSRILPLFQQNEYLASLRNSYSHTINFVPITIINNTNEIMCFDDIVVYFYDDRYLKYPKFSVKRSEYPFAFSDNDTGSAVSYTLTESYCLSPGESKEFTLSLTPEVFINPNLTSITELPIGLKENGTYFISIGILDGTDETILDNPHHSVSCTECTGVPLKYDYTSCSINYALENTSNGTLYVNTRLRFYTTSDLTNEVATITASPTSSELTSFAIGGVRADNLWGNSGLKLNAGEKVIISGYPALSQATGLLCGYTYYVVGEWCYTTSTTTPCTNWEEISNSAYYWICNCQSVRWGGDDPTAIVDVSRWNSSGFGYSDTRVTISPGNSLNPMLRIYNTNQGIIVYQDDRIKQGTYLIYGSVFKNWPNSSMRASGTMHSSDILNAKSILWEEGGSGQHPVIDIDIYSNIFLAYETTQSDSNKETYGDKKVFQENTQNTITVHKCGYSTSFGTDVTDPCSASTPVSEQQFILGYSDVASLLSNIVKQIRVKNDYVRYHITRNQTSTPVVKQRNIIFDVIGTPEVVAIRFKNEDTTKWSTWLPFENIGDYRAEIPWTLSIGNGLKTIYFQVATYQGIASYASIELVADYDSISYDIKLYSNVDRKEENLLSNYNSVPVASIKIPADETQIIYIDIIPSETYLSQFSNPSDATPTFDVFTQGIDDILDQQTEYKVSTRGRVFEGSFVIKRGTSSGSQDGLSMIVPHFVNDPQSLYEPNVQYKSYNFFNSTSTQTELNRDASGKVRYSITSRPNDPYLIFGDPNYYLHKENN